SAQLLFAAADSRMYSEKHSRKTGWLSAASHASWRLFVRAGQALGREGQAAAVMQEIAEAAREEFALTACIVKPSGDAAPAIAASDAGLASALARLSERGTLDAGALAGEMP